MAFADFTISGADAGSVLAIAGTPTPPSGTLAVRFLGEEEIFLERTSIGNVLDSYMEFHYLRVPSTNTVSMTANFRKQGALVTDDRYELNVTLNSSPGTGLGLVTALRYNSTVASTLGYFLNTVGLGLPSGDSYTTDYARMRLSCADFTDFAGTRTRLRMELFDPGPLNDFVEVMTVEDWDQTNRISTSGRMTIGGAGNSTAGRQWRLDDLIFGTLT